MSRVTSRAKRSEIFKVQTPSGVDPRPVIAVGLQLLHERQPTLALLPGIEEHHRDVAGASAEMLEQRGGPEERVERAGTAEDHERAVDVRRVRGAELVDALLDVRGEPVRTVDVLGELL